MPEPMVLMTADWHGSVTTWNEQPNLRWDSLHSLGQIFDYAIEYDVPVLGAGDLLNDSEPDSEVVYRIIQQCERRRGRGSSARGESFRVGFVQGQHDKVLTGHRPWLGLSSWTNHLDGCYESLTTTIKVAGLDHVPAARLHDSLHTVCGNNVDLLVCHQVWKDFMGPHIGGEGSFSQIPTVRHVLTGDFHEHRVVKAIGASGQEMTIFSPGSISMRSLAEPPDKAIFLLYDDFSYKSLPLRTRPFHAFACENEAGFQDVLDRLDELLEAMPILESLGEEKYDPLMQPIIKIQRPDDVHEAYGRLLKCVNNRGYLFDRPFSVRAKELVQECISALPASNHDGLLEQLQVCCYERPEDLSLGTMLLNSNQPIQDLRMAREKFLEMADKGS